MDPGSVEIIYDDSDAWQEVLRQIRIARRAGRNPTCVLMSTETAKIIVEQTEFAFEEDEHVFIRIGGLPMILRASIPECSIYLGYG